MDDMKDNVHLVFVTHHEHLWAYNLTRKMASQIMRDWWNARERVRTKAEGWEGLRDWLERGTFALNRNPEGKPDYADMVVGWEHVIGMYIYDIEQSTQERIAASQEKLVKMMEKQSKQGDEWKGEGE